MPAEIDRELLAKLLGMSQSAHDGEALAAIRKANDLLARSGETWEAVLAPGLDRPAPDARRAEPRQPPSRKPAHPLRRFLLGVPFSLRLLLFPFWIVLWSYVLFREEQRYADRFGLLLGAVALAVVAFIVWIALIGAASLHLAG